jgi:SAM-dependent methyltransferase
MTSNSGTPVEQAIRVFDQQYRARGMRSQRTYPNESLIRFLASRYFDRSVEERQAIRALEVGCGSGANLWMMAKEGFNTHGIDSSREGIALARRHLKDKWGVSASLAVGSFTDLPYADARFDLVVDVVSLQHLSLADSAVALADIARVLKPEGALFSHRLSDRSVMREAGRHVDRATLDNIADAGMPLANNGPTSFWSPALAGEMYGQVGLAVDSVERTGRTYANGMFVEYLSLVGVKSVAASPLAHG